MCRSSLLLSSRGSEETPSGVFVFVFTRTHTPAPTHAHGDTRSHSVFFCSSVSLSPRSRDALAHEAEGTWLVQDLRPGTPYGQAQLCDASHKAPCSVAPDAQKKVPLGPGKRDKRGLSDRPANERRRLSRLF